MSSSCVRRPITGLAALGVFCLLTVSQAEATPISYDYTYNPTDVYINNANVACTGDTATNSVSALSCETLQFTFVLAGHDSSTDTLASATLTLTFFDDTDPGPGVGGSHTESVNISLDGVLTSDSPVLITNGSTSFSRGFDVLLELGNGELTVLLGLPASAQGNNDFYFASSRLVAQGNRADQTGSVPEPATVLLVGLAAAGAATRRLRRGRA
jgi:PEP-CTERM motif